MSYKHRTGQLHQSKQREQRYTTVSLGRQKLATALLAALPMFTVLGATAVKICLYISNSPHLQL